MIHRMIVKTIVFHTTIHKKSHINFLVSSDSNYPPKLLVSISSYSKDVAILMISYLSLYCYSLSKYYFLFYDN